jgi:hypothetical protein
MKKFIYMNHRIAQVKPQAPVIVVQTGKRQREGNRVDIMDRGKIVASVVYDPLHNPSATHRVRAWVETNKTVVIAR